MLDAETLRRLLDYDPETGVFLWKVSRQRVSAGDIAGTISSKGYVVIGINRNIYKAHRLAWLHFYGEWPSKNLDHADCNRSNNRISNLRQASISDNNKNYSKPITNTSGYKGVYYYKSKNIWRSIITANNRRMHLGYFSTPEDAHLAYCEAAKKYHGEFFNPGTATEPHQDQKMISAQRS